VSWDTDHKSSRRRVYFGAGPLHLNRARPSPYEQLPSHWYAFSTRYFSIAAALKYLVFSHMRCWEPVSDFRSIHGKYFALCSVPSTHNPPAGGSSRCCYPQIHCPVDDARTRWNPVLTLNYIMTLFGVIARRCRMFRGISLTGCHSFLTAALVRTQCLNLHLPVRLWASAICSTTRAARRWLKAEAMSMRRSKCSSWHRATPWIGHLHLTAPRRQGSRDT
jgi:hypothetical protein